MRRLSVAVGSLLLAGCMPAPAAPAPVAGPTLVIDVTNGSSEEVILGFEWESVGAGGSGETFVAPCRREAAPFSTVSGEYRVLVDGEEVAGGSVPDEAGADAFFVIRVRVGPDGEAEAAPPVVVLREPPYVSAAIPCG